MGGGRRCAGAAGGDCAPAGQGSVRKASKMRSDHLEVLICGQQGKAIFATGDRNQNVVDQRAWPIFVWHAILAKKGCEDAAAVLEGHWGRTHHTIATLEHIADSALQD